MSKWGYALRYQQNDFCGSVYFPLFLHFLWMYSISWIKCLGAYLKILTERGGVPDGQEGS